MTYDFDEGSAAEYVLGTLAGAARRRFAAALAGDRELQAQVAAWERRLHGLERGAGTIAPSAGVWRKIEAALDGVDEPAVDGVTVRAAEGDWQVILDGIEKKVLFFDKAARSESFLLRFAPDTRLPAHRHREAEECLVIEGTFMIGDVRLDPGDFQAFDADTFHPETYCERGGLVYVRGELRNAAG